MLKDTNLSNGNQYVRAIWWKWLTCTASERVTKLAGGRKCLPTAISIHNLYAITENVLQDWSSGGSEQTVQRYCIVEFNLICYVKICSIIVWVSIKLLCETCEVWGHEKLCQYYFLHMSSLIAGYILVLKREQEARKTKSTLMQMSQPTGVWIIIYVGLQERLREGYNWWAEEQ